jgi:2-hydroxychromene-2-carboxylate isomerase
MAKGRLEFIFDYSSPYAYFGSLRVEPVAARHGLELIWTPIVLGGVFQVLGTKPLIDLSPARAKYTFEDLRDLADYFQVPYKPRTAFIVRSVLALRATLQIPQGPERARAAHALFHAAWAQDADLGDAATVTRVLTLAGFDGAQLVEGTQQQSVKDELKRNTDQAIARGVFGTPTFVADGGKMFWGHDRLDVVDRYLSVSKAS